MKQMNLREWSQLTEDQRNEWISNYQRKDLIALLGMIGDMLIEADSFDAELSVLTHPDDVLVSARDFTHNTLRDVEHHIVQALENKRPLLLEKAV